MKIKKRQLVQLIREIVQQTLNEVQSGEWWIYPGGDAQFADGDVGDSNHEGYVIEYISREIIEHFTGYASDEIGLLSNWEHDIFNVLQKDERLTEEEIEEWENRGKGGGPVDVIIRKLLEDKMFSSPEQAEEAVYIAYGSNRLDARDYAMKYLGWKRMTTTGGWGTEFQTWFLRQSDLDDMAKGIFDAWGDDGGDEEANATHKVSVEVRANDKVFSDIPLNVFDRASVSDIVTYRREAAWMREGKEQTYLSIGHNTRSIMWVWKNGKFKTAPTSRYKTHSHWAYVSRDSDVLTAEFIGRFDPKTNKLSLSATHIKSLHPSDVPLSLIQRLEFEFGDTSKLRIFESYTDYTSIGHGSLNDILWTYNNGSFETVKASKFPDHYSWSLDEPSVKRRDFQGRYDTARKIISLADMGAYRSGAGKTSIENVPEDLIRRLKFEFGDSARISTFYEEKKSAPVFDPINFTQYG